MKNWMLIVSVVFCSSGLFAKITSYNEVGIDPNESQLHPNGDVTEGYAEEAQGVTSDRLGHWFFSNKYHIYRYDEDFSTVSQNYVGSLGEVNDAISDVNCGHLGSIHYFDGHIYVEVDDCTREESLPELGVSCEDEEEIKTGYKNYFDNKYGILGDIVVEVDEGDENYYVYYKSNGLNVEVCKLAYFFSRWLPYECYTKPSFAVKFSADTLDVVDYAEFVTPDGLPIKSSGSLCANIDVVSTNEERHAVFEFDQTRDFEKGFRS